MAGAGKLELKFGDFLLPGCVVSCPALSVTHLLGSSGVEHGNLSCFQDGEAFGCCDRPGSASGAWVTLRGVASVPLRKAALGLGLQQSSDKIHGVYLVLYFPLNRAVLHPL